MTKLPRLLLLCTLTLALSGCDLWDDMVDSVSGSGDDDPEPIVQTTVAQSEAPAPAVAKPATVEKKEAVEEQKETEYETRFHHTATGSKDGGKSLVLCSGQKMKFTSCLSDGTSIPFHGYDHGRETYWNMHKEPQGDIVCKKDGKTYRFRADTTFVYGLCR